MRKKPTVRRHDPTRTTLWQRAFMNELARRQQLIADAVLEHVGKHDTYGLGKSPTANARYQFSSDSDKQKAFGQWLQSRLDGGLLGLVGDTDPNSPPGSQYIASAYKQGLIRAYTDAHKRELANDPSEYTKSMADFLATSFGGPEALSKIEGLATRTFEEMKGLSAYEKTSLNRILADAMANGSGADETAREMVDQIGVITRSRANMIARTEIIRAHAEGQLDAFQQLGVEELGVEAEWVTADDDAVCEDCQGMADDSPYTVDEARGLIPLHPNCRCAWVPVAQESKRSNAAERIRASQTDDEEEQPPEEADAEEEVASLDLGGD